MFSLLRPEDVLHFKALLLKAGSSWAAVREHKLGAEQLEEQRLRLGGALQQVGE